MYTIITNIFKYNYVFGFSVLGGIASVENVHYYIMKHIGPNP